jgi:antitoxin ParD1/3/4
MRSSASLGSQKRIVPLKLDRTDMAAKPTKAKKAVPWKKGAQPASDKPRRDPWTRKDGEMHRAGRDFLWYKTAMSITLTPEQEAWIKAHIATGDFASIEEAARQLIDDRIAELAADDDDMAWAKPLVDEARAAIARGEFVSLEEHKAHNAALLASLKD